LHQVDLSVIIVNWNVRDLLRRCLASITGSDGLCVAGLDTLHYSTGEGSELPLTAHHSPVTDHRSPITVYRAEIIIVDNASADASVAMLREEFPWVQVIPNTQNLGFTRANNQGLAQSQGRYVLFLNPDTEVHAAALRTMLDYAETYPAVGVIGPQLRYADGSVQSSRRRFPTVATFFLEATVLQRWWPRQRVLDRYYVLDRPDDVVSAVDWVVGACMLVRRAVLDQIGGFDEGFFMYAEEMDLCRRAVTAGWQVIYLPAAVVKHHEGKSSEQVVAARHIRFHTSRVRYVRKHHGQLAATAVRSFLLLTFVYLWTEEAAKWLASFVLASQRAKRAMRRERMNAYAQVLRSGLRFAKPI
jgi:hypothetical protein